MAESNHAALNQGLKIYTDAMRRLVRERLVRAFPNSWWESGVVSSLTPGQQQSLKRNAQRDPEKDLLDHVDASHLVEVITKHFHGPFRGVFSDFTKTQSWLMQVESARNDWAHPRSGDMLADEVGHALYAMVQILTTAKLPEATEVERIRKDVLGIEVAPANVRVRHIATAPSELPYWWQVSEPHDAFKNPATIDESLFAATLGGVHAGSAREEYLKPAVFFSHTHFTENLKQTIRDVASRLAGGAGPSVTEMQTPFGGGKTHALLTLYHLIRSPRESLAVPGVREALGDVSIPAEARVLVFDGQEWGTEPVTKEDTAVVQTLWGELAHQASPALFDKEIMASDGRGEAPGNAVFRRVLQAASPCLILIDELVSYLVKLKFSSSRRTQNLYRQTVQFLQEMLQEAGNVPGVCVLISLPKSRREFGGLDPLQLQNELAVVDELQARADRVVSKRTPVNDDEIHTLMSKRLFKRTDPDVARRVARAYRETYERTRSLYDPGIFSADYLEHQVSAYPLHPELVDVLYKKWSTASGFPRTRAVLQLLASIVADQWVHRREAYTIQSAHVDLERERIRTRIVSAANEPGYDAVVAADIIGGDAHADEQDQRRGAEYERHHVARGIATTLLMHSFGGGSRLGAQPTELRLGTVAPNVGPEYVSEVMEALEQSLWYVHRDGDLLRFQTKPNIYRMISTLADDQPPASVAERLRESLGRAIGSAEDFRILEWAAADGAIADRPEPTIAVLDARYAVSREDGDGPIVGRDRIDQLWEKSGGGFREWRNALVLVAPDRELWARADEAMREVMAYESVIANAEKGTLELSQLERKDLKSRADDKRESLRTSTTTAYRWVFYPDEQGLSAISLPVPATKDERIVTRAVKRLSDQDYGTPKILARMGAVYFNSKLAPRLWRDESSPLDLAEISRRFPQWTYLPILPRREETLRACLREGIAQQLWAVVVGDNSTSTYRDLLQSPEQLDELVTLFDGSASLVKGDLLSLIREELGVDAESGDGERPGQGGMAPAGGLSKVIQKSFGGEITPRGEVSLQVIPGPSRRLTRLRIRIDRLSVGKTGNLQPYLFKVLQEQDAGAELAIAIDVSSAAGISPDALEQRIVEAFDQLGISVSWEAV